MLQPQMTGCWMTSHIFLISTIFLFSSEAMETPTTKPPTTPMFGLNDTQQMMYAFGDARRPNIETAKLSMSHGFLYHDS
jgi:hypothetical protein